MFISSNHQLIAKIVNNPHVIINNSLSHLKIPYEYAQGFIKAWESDINKQFITKDIEEKVALYERYIEIIKGLEG